MNETNDIKKKILTAKIDYEYHKRIMEFEKEKIKLLEKELNTNKVQKTKTTNKKKDWNMPE